MSAERAADPAPSGHPFRSVRLATDRHIFDRRADGTVYVRCEEPLGPYAARVTDWLVRFASEATDRTFVAKRDRSGAWQRLTYGDALSRAERLGAALLSRGLSAERPLVILSGADLDHAALALAAMHVGVPYAPVSPAYSAFGGAYERLRDILSLLTPGLVYAGEAAAFGPAIAATLPPDVEVVIREGTLVDRKATFLAEFEAGRGQQIAAAHQGVGPDTIAKFLFTSGSTGLPKAVVTTHRMLCANAAQLQASFPFLTEEPPVLIDWLPWHHVFGGSHNFDIVLSNGGSLYIDDGRPTPALIGETVRNLREIAPTAYFTVPKGYESLIPHLRNDDALRESFYRRLKLTFFAAAGLPQPIWDALDGISVSHAGERIPMLTGLGATETAPFALVCRPDQCRSGRVGLPVRGVELKLAPVEDKLEARVRGPNVTPGYWRNPELSAAARDEEGFYRFGDALRFVDPAKPEIGLYFDGRLNEDFKLTTGVWVSVGPLRAQFLNAAAPLARDIAIAGEGRDAVMGLIVPDMEECRALCPDLDAAVPAAEVLADERVRAAFARVLSRLAQASTGSSNRIAGALLLDKPPSIDLNEVTDKGSINQRATLRNRAALVEELYAEPPSPRVIRPGDA
ncbi:AMP-binding protein [Enterovirga aerilata]|uniref:Feruloyl-CoA synthase n=1 Tax=Enterovirga aerilata TaxID=2730920 RepID=A0A849I4F1_9HYPH|nr:feruloyl-CoA synthase [Enterovirga sp. DB1703]